MTKTPRPTFWIARSSPYAPKHMWFKPPERRRKRHVATFQASFDDEPPLQIPFLYPQEAIRKRQRLIAESPNVIDLNSYRERATHVPGYQERPVGIPFLHNQQQTAGINCSVRRPGQWFAEVFVFARVPVKGEDVVLSYEPGVYVVRSITHLACEPGSVSRPCVQIRLRAKRKKKH
jgi:hypothetical protein